MEWIKWTDNYSVSVKTIDEQHKKLVVMINELYDAMSSGNKEKDILSKIIQGLANYAVYHFGTEEDWMKKFAFPGYAFHKGEHDNFVAKVSEFGEKFNKGTVLLDVEVLKFLKDWLLNHILKTDKLYTACFNQNGIS